MEKQEKRKGGGAKTSRSETVTVRLDPKLRYLAEIAARVQRRTLSSYIEWAVEDSLQRAVMVVKNDGKDLSVADVNGKTPLWDIQESDRFAILADHFPNLLTYDEQRLAKLIDEVWLLMKGSMAAAFGSMIRGHRFDVNDRELLRANWQLFKDAVESGRPASSVVMALKAVSASENAATRFRARK